jgi:hypothetical protein
MCRGGSPSHLSAGERSSIRSRSAASINRDLMSSGEYCRGGTLFKLPGRAIGAENYRRSATEPTAEQKKDPAEAG